MKKFNLSLDDYSPRENTNDITWCFELINKYPDIKIDLFVPAAYARLSDKQPSYLSKNKNWVDNLKRLPKNFNICLHGMYHRRKGDKRHPDSNNDEWQFLSYNEAKVKIDLMKREFDLLGIKYSKVFRPPGWKISSGAALALHNDGFIIAGNKEYFNKISNGIKNIKWISYNWDLLDECSAENDVIAYGHTSKWTNNYIDEKRFKLICNVLDNSRFNFCFIGELAGV